MSSEGNISAKPPRQTTIRLPELAELVQLDHDLRATLADIAAGLDLIGDDDVALAARSALKRSRAAVSMLCRLLEDGLQNSLAASALPVATPVELDIFAVEMRDRWQDDGRLGRGIVEMTIGPDLSTHRVTDRVALERMLANLIWNGQRHSRSGRVACRVEVEGKDLCLVVSDRGPGFPRDRLEQGIAPSPPLLATMDRGSGLGLVIARQMALKLGGVLHLHNPPEGGAEVTFRMPLEPSPPLVARSAPLPDLKGMRILVADDSESIRLVTERVLSGMGATVELHSDGAAALEALSLHTFDAMVLDVEMPGFSGLDVLRALSDSPVKLPRVATVMITGHARREERDSLRQAGADAVLVKPVLCPFALGAAVIGAVQRRAGRASGVSDALVLPDESTLQRLLQIAGPDAGAELMVRLLDDLKTVEERLIAALPTLDFMAIRAQTHVLVSVAGAVGAVGLQHMAERLNTAANGEDGVAIKEGLARLLTDLDALIQIIADKQLRISPGASA
jgi:two-component system aerobic respiration control sensor histidine kinase ArcB